MTLNDPRLPDRFWAKVSPSPTGCWLWTSSCDSSGYGSFSLDRRTYGAHRLSYLTLRGPIPEGLQIDHLCRVTRCVNPDHLEPVTDLENKRRRFAIYTHCRNGHEYTDANTYHRPSGRRDCRQCIRERVWQYRARARAKRAGVA